MEGRYTPFPQSGKLQKKNKIFPKHKVNPCVRKPCTFLQLILKSPQAAARPQGGSGFQKPLCCPAKASPCCPQRELMGPKFLVARACWDESRPQFLNGNILKQLLGVNPNPHSVWHQTRPVTTLPQIFPLQDGFHWGGAVDYMKLLQTLEKDWVTVFKAFCPLKIFSQTFCYGGGETSFSGPLWTFCTCKHSLQRQENSD